MNYLLINFFHFSLLDFFPYCWTPGRSHYWCHRGHLSAAAVCPAAALAAAAAVGTTVCAAVVVGATLPFVLLSCHGCAAVSAAIAAGPPL